MNWLHPIVNSNASLIYSVTPPSLPPSLNSMCFCYRDNWREEREAKASSKSVLHLVMSKIFKMVPVVHYLNPRIWCTNIWSFQIKKKEHLRVICSFFEEKKRVICSFFECLRKENMRVICSFFDNSFLRVICSFFEYLCITFFISLENVENMPTIKNQ